MSYIVIIFFIAYLSGVFTGVVFMCLLQIHRLHDKESNIHIETMWNGAQNLMEDEDEMQQL